MHIHSEILVTYQFLSFSDDGSYGSIRIVILINICIGA